MSGVVQLRPVLPPDLECFYQHQLDVEATRMAAFPSRQREAFMGHWARILADPTNTIRTILLDGIVAGNIVCFPDGERRLIGYWLGREYWGQGIATHALSQFLLIVTSRPLYARAAAENRASIRVLQKCGFSMAHDDPRPPRSVDDETTEVVLVLDAGYTIA
jgi:RimJ/RimL family protein N-acetyltransferase